MDSKPMTRCTSASSRSLRRRSCVRHLDTEGESLEHLVIRSAFGTTAADYATSAAVKAALEQVGAEHAYAADSLATTGPAEGIGGDGRAGRSAERLRGPANQMATALRVALREGGTFLDETIVDTARARRRSPSRRS